MRSEEEIEQVLNNVSEEEWRTLEHIINSDLEKDQVSSILVGILLIMFNHDHKSIRKYFDEQAENAKRAAQEAEKYEKWTKKRP